MPSFDSVLNDIRRLDPSDKERLVEYFERVLLFGHNVEGVADEIKEGRFSKGKVCPHCGHHEISRNGRYRPKNSPEYRQRYLCGNPSCKKSFTDFTKAPISSSKKSLNKWILYAKCMVNGLSLRKSLEYVDISLTTAFFWRHKILDAIRLFMGRGSVGGVIEVDETYFAQSFKGNHKKSTNFIMPRTPRKRGKEVKLRGISREQVCVLCAVDRIGNIMAELVTNGRMKCDDLERMFDGCIDEESILCTDSHASYIKFAKNYGLEHQRIKSGKHKEGIYHIQHINAFHSNLKNWIIRFKGVATKYLANYLYWFKWMQLFKNEKDAAKSKSLIIHSSTAKSTTRIADFKHRQAIYV